MGMFLPTGYSGLEEFVRHLVHSKHPNVMASASTIIAVAAAATTIIVWLCPCRREEWEKEILFQTTPHRNPEQPPSQLLAASDVVCGYEITGPFMSLSHAFSPAGSPTLPASPVVPLTQNPRAEMTGERCFPLL